MRRSVASAPSAKPRGSRMKTPVPGWPLNGIAPMALLAEPLVSQLAKGDLVVQQSLDEWRIFRWRYDWRPGEAKDRVCRGLYLLERAR